MTQAYRTLVRRELGSSFLGLSGYVLVAAVLFLLGVGFVVLLTAVNNEVNSLPLTELFYSTMFFWLVLLLAAPVITMRTFAQERSAGTFETLMTTPVSDLEVVLAKFTAALGFHLVTWLPLLACLRVVQPYAGGAAALDWGAVGTTYLGILLLGALYMAMGCFASALTRSQIIAAMIALALGISLFLLSFLKFSLPLGGGWVSQALTQVSVIDHMEDFVRGIVDTRHVVFYLSGTAFFLFLTLKVVESRRWK